MDSTGSTYVTGITYSTNFPAANAFQGSLKGVSDAFVTKLGSTGALVYSTYLGGSATVGGEDARGIAVDGAGNAYVTGSTVSTNFPTVNAVQATLRGRTDAFVTKLNPTGSALLFSTYLGGNDDDVASGIGLDSTGNAYVVGSTASFNFPTVDALETYTFGTHVFVTKLVPNGTTLVYSTYFGGSDGTAGAAIAVDASGGAYITGNTNSVNFPTVNAFQPAGGGIAADAFVSKIGELTTCFASFPTLTSISVTPGNPAIAIGGRQQFTATGTFSDCSTQDLTGTVTWGSATPGVATISAGGLATATTAGTSLITATSGSIFGSTTLTVNNPQAIDYRISTSPPSIALIASATKTSQISLQSVNGGSDIVNLSSAWSGTAPTGLTVALSPNSVTVPSTGLVSAMLTIKTLAAPSTGTFTLTVTGTSASGVIRSANVSIEIATSLAAPTCGCSKTGPFMDPRVKGLVSSSPLATVPLLQTF